MTVLAWGAKVSPEFRARVIEIASRMGFDPCWLMACMQFESGIDPSRQNNVSGATGLVQFMPSTARGLGTTVEELAGMTGEAQLNFVAAYFQPYKGRIKTFSDCYMAILWPAAIGQPEDYTIFEKDSRAYEQNKALDIRHVGSVTKADAASFPAKRLTEGLQPGNVWDGPETVPQPEAKPMGALAIPFLQTILPAVIGLFAPKVQAQIEKTTGASPDASAAFLQSLMGQVAKASGVTVTDQTTAIQAVAKVTADPAAVAEVESHALDYLDKLGPMFDKLAAAEAATNAQSVIGMNAAAARAQTDKWDMTPWLVWFAGGTSTVLILGLLGVIVYQATTKDRSIDVGLIGIAGPLLAIAMSVWREIFSYRFDGSKNSDTQTALATAITTASNRATK